MPKTIHLSLKDDAHALLLNQAEADGITLTAFCIQILTRAAKGVPSPVIPAKQPKSEPEPDSPINPVGRPKGKSKATLEREEREWEREWRGIKAANERSIAAREAAQQEPVIDLDKLLEELEDEPSKGVQP